VVISLIVLIPNDRPQFTGDALLGVAVVALFTVLPAAAEAIGNPRRRALPRRVVLSRFGVATVTALGLAAVGAGFLAADYHDALTGLVGVVMLMLVVSVRNTWDLLVTLATK
jgi:uncharacterized membrane protein